MPNDINQVLGSITDEAAAEAKQQLQQWLEQTKQAGQGFVKECAQQLEQWLIDLAAGDITALEFNRLVSAQELLLANLALHEAAEGQQRAENTAIKILESTAEKVVPALLLAL